MAGGGTISTKATKLEALKLQSSTYGATLPAVFGVTRIPGNMLWYGGFKAIKHTETQRAGKGGGTKVKTVTYTYTAHVAMGLTEGQILGIPRVWRGKDQYSGGITSTQIVTATETYVVPGGGGAKTLTNAAGWRCTVRVFYTGAIDVGDGTTTGPIYLAEGVDYTVAAGVYTFGSQWGGTTISIEYQYLTGSLTQSGLASLGLTMFSGAIGQTTWSVLSTSFVAQAIPYSGIAYVAGQDYDLGSDATVPNHNFEVQARLAYHLGASVPDVDPALVTLAVLTDQRYGALFGAGRLNLSLWSTYCRAAGLLMSPALTEQMQAADLVRQMAALTNTAPVWSSGQLKMIPFGDQALSGNGATYTPNVTPLYDLDDRHFLPRGSGGEPVSITPRASRDAKNWIRVEFLDRSQDYNVSIAEAKDQADIDTTGLRPADILKAHWIHDRAVAARVAQLLLQRSLHVRNEYEFKLPWTFALLEPMDLVTLTESYLGLSLTAVRILEVAEGEDGEIDVVAEEFPAGVATASTYGSQGGDGYKANFNASPGSVLAPFIFEAPGDKTLTGLEVYAAVNGASDDWGGCNVWVSLDGVSYYNAGAVYGGSRYGVLTGPVSGGNLPVQLNAGETLVAASAADAAALTSLCYVGGSSPEYFAHQGATLTGASAYTLSGLVRGAYGTSGAAAHAASDPFARVDAALAKSGPLELSMIGKTIYFKFTSFNLVGGAEQDLADVTQYSYTITGAMAALGTASSKLVSLSADKQVFTFDGSGRAAPTSQTITFTARRQHTVAPTTWTATPSVALGGSGDTRTLTLEAFGSNTSVKVRAEADGVWDEITVVRLQGGAIGASGVNLIRNGNAELGSNANFTGTTLLGAGNALTYQASGGFDGGPCFTTGAVGWNVFVSDETIPVDPSAVYEVSCYHRALEADVPAYIGFACVDANGEALGPERCFRYAGADTTLQAAITSTGATSFRVVPPSTNPTGFTSALAVQFGTLADDSDLPTSAASTRYLGPGYVVDTSTAGLGYWTITLGAGYTVGATYPVGTRVSFSSSGGSYNYLLQAGSTQPQVWTRRAAYLHGQNGKNEYPQHYHLWRGAVGIRFLFFQSPASGTRTSYIDGIALRRVDAALVGYLTNEAVALPASSSGAVLSYAGASGQFKVFFDGRDVTADCTFSEASDPQALTPNPSIVASGGSAGAYSVTGGFDAGEATATITYRATYYGGAALGLTLDQVLTLTKSAAGATGADGITVTLSRPAVSVPARADGTNPTLTNTGTEIRVYEGTTLLAFESATPGTTSGNSAWRLTSAPSGNSTISPGAVTDSGSYATVAAATAFTADTGRVTFTINGKRANGTAFSALVAEQVFAKVRNAEVQELTVSASAGTYQASSSGAAESGGVSATITPTITVSGGTAPYTYAWAETFDTTGGVNCSNTAIEEPTFGHTGAVFQFSAAYASWRLTVTDSNGLKGWVDVGFRFRWVNTS